MSGGPGGAPGKTLEGVQRAKFVPNVNARRNKKQVDPASALDKLLNADEQQFERAEHRRPQPRTNEQRGESSKGQAADSAAAAAAVKQEPGAGGGAVVPRGLAPTQPSTSDGPAVLQIPSSHAAKAAAAAALPGGAGAESDQAAGRGAPVPASPSNCSRHLLH